MSPQTARSGTHNNVTSAHTQQHHVLKQQSRISREVNHVPFNSPIRLTHNPAHEDTRGAPTRTTSAVIVPPGWYSDPNQAGERWLDGTQWTADVVEVSTFALFQGPKYRIAESENEKGDLTS